MITRIGFAPGHPSLSLDQLQAHWTTRHAEVTLKLPHIQRYWQNQPVLRDGANLLPWPGFDVCSEFDFAEPVDMDRTFSSPAYFEHVKPDEDHLLDKSRGGMLVAERVHLEGDPAEPEFRLLTFFRTAPLRQPGALASALAAMPGASTATARQIYATLEGGAAGQRVGMFDAVEINGFDSAERAHDFALSPEQRERRLAVAELARGTENLVARVRKVV
jgi:hypothetical protein